MFAKSLVAAALLLTAPGFAAGLTVSQNETLEAPGLSVIVHQNVFHPVFRDEKNAGLQMVLHDVRLATDGEVRLSPTPEQWDPVPAVTGRAHGPKSVTVASGYADIGLAYHITVTPEGEGFRITVDLDAPLKADLVGKAGFNLDFLPVSYFGKTFLMGEAPGLFPRQPNGPVKKDGSGDPEPIAAGAKTIVLAPEDPKVRVAITSDTAPLALYDARNRAQNGWFVVRALIPAGATRNAIVWHVKPNVVKGWMRTPVVSFNQAGYTPNRAKVAIIEMDPRFKAPAEAMVVKLDASGKPKPVFRGRITPWGKWLRYKYARFDFSKLTQPGIYAISFAGHTTNPFRIAPDAYAHAWQASLDTYLPVQMDHMTTREQYRIWHGPAHLDDARQAPPNHKHFDGYDMGANLDSPFQPGQHIPGLAVGGWFDAGDFDIQTPSQGFVIRDLVTAKELFGLDWDETTIDEDARYAEIRRPDGVNDALQQVRHGTLQLLAQYKVFGHTIIGIIDPVLRQYTHLGDGASQTDRLIYDPALKPNQTTGGYSAIPDDRWAFTTSVPGVNYTSTAALAAASRALKDLDPALASEALAAAKAMWASEQANPKPQPKEGAALWFGGKQVMGEIGATVELVLATKGEATYTARLKALVPQITDQENFAFVAAIAVRAIPYMDADYKAALRAAVVAGKPMIDAEIAKTPFGVPVGLKTWAGSHEAIAFGSSMYILHQAFPDVIGKEYTLAAFDYVLGRHPANNLSMVSTIGTSSKLIGYGGNRADYSFIPGGVLPGVLVIKPDYPEMTPNWPFFWYENEYVIGNASAYILMANAAIAATKE
jgi:endoglucanase